MKSTSPLDNEGGDRYGLSRFDRLLLRAYLGYTPILQFPEDRSLKTKEEAPVVLQNLLWGDDDDLTQELDLDDVRGEKRCELKSILKTTDETIKIMLKEAKDFTTSQQCAVLKAFAVGIFISFLFLFLFSFFLIAIRKQKKTRPDMRLDGSRSQKVVTDGPTDLGTYPRIEMLCRILKKKDKATLGPSTSQF